MNILIAMDIREKLIKLFYDNNVICDQKIEGLADDVMDIIAPVRHGHWYEGHEMMTCTNCCEQFDLYFKNDFNYCPNCGAKMNWWMTNDI